MEKTEFDELAFFRAIADSGARALLIGRRDGKRVVFDDLWTRREHIAVSPIVSIAVPCLDDLEDTKRFGARPKDAEDLRLLQALRASRRES